MAECHPVGFQWVMEAKARGATVIHIDPRYTRTSAVADLYVPLRAGSDIVLLGALIWASLPSSAVWAIGLLVGIELVLYGMTLIGAGAAGRRLAHAA